PRGAGENGGRCAAAFVWRSPGTAELSSDGGSSPGRVPRPVRRPRAPSRTRREESRPAHRLMSSTGYSSRVALQHCPLRFTGCRHSAMNKSYQNKSYRSTDLQRTANCVLTICLTSGGKRTLELARGLLPSAGKDGVEREARPQADGSGENRMHHRGMVGVAAEAHAFMVTEFFTFPGAAI